MSKRSPNNIAHRPSSVLECCIWPEKKNQKRFNIWVWLKDGWISVYVTLKRIHDEILLILKASNILFTQENVLEIAMLGWNILASTPARGQNCGRHLKEAKAIHCKTWTMRISRVEPPAKRKAALDQVSCSPTESRGSKHACAAYQWGAALNFKFEATFCH